MLYYATAHLHIPAREFWVMPMGLFLDLWTCHRQYMGWDKEDADKSVCGGSGAVYIDDVIPFGI